jgi:membrane protease YdiL (CAAX protease family)
MQLLTWKTLPGTITFLLFTSILFGLWTARSWFAYEFLGVETMDMLSNEQLIYLRVTKFFWLVLAFVLSIKYFGSKWNVQSYLLRLNVKDIRGLLAALFPIMYVLLFLITSGNLPEAVDWLIVLGVIPSVLFEESLFRGFLLPFLEQFKKPLLANTIQASIFLLVHYCWWYFDAVYVERINFESSIYIFAVGLLWGYSAQRTKSITLPILSHILHNAILSI